MRGLGHCQTISFNAIFANLNAWMFHGLPFVAFEKHTLTIDTGQ